MACEWEIDRTCVPLPVEPTPPESEEGLPAYEIALAAYDVALAQALANEDMAVSVLWALSGRQFGLCPVTVRPCVQPAWTVGGGHSAYILTMDFGHWTNWPCGCSTRCEVSGPRVVHLPGPAAEVIAVTVDDVVLDDDAYVLEGNALYRRGGASWPTQNLGAPLGEAGTWGVEYLRGLPVPPGVASLTGTLVREFANACSDDGECRLPRTLTATSRKGATNVFDASKILANGKTGLPEVDLWLASVNPNHLAQASSVL